MLFVWKRHCYTKFIQLVNNRISTITFIHTNIILFTTKTAERIVMKFGKEIDYLYIPGKDIGYILSSEIIFKGVK